MDDLLAEFTAETREMLEALGVAIVAWEAAPQDRSRLDEIFRFVHTVKGNCGFFDLPRLETLSHAAEGALAEVRGGHRAADRSLVSAVLAIIDRIAELVQALESGEPVSSADDEQLIAALSQPSDGNRAVQVGTGAARVDARKAVRSIRLPVDVLDRMMNGVSDMVLARNELARRLREARSDAAIDAAFERLCSCVGEMRDAITRTRMQRMDSLFVILPRMVRDIGAELGKSVLLDVDGGDVELDREMIEMIRDPLTHIVRNAIDHGIETPEERRLAGKPVNGSLRVSARQSGNQILIEIIDDGRGVDGEMVARKAVANGLLRPDQADRLTSAQKAALIFRAGLSTALEVTAISGRGVGMDVVRANIERIGGLVEIESKIGQGVRLTLRVPLTLTIIPTLTVSVASRRYAIPRSAIEEIVRARSETTRIESIGGARVAAIRDRRMPLVSLADVLGVEHAHGPEDLTLIVLKPAGGADYALAVDVVHDHEELVVKPAAPAVMAIGLYAGTTLADDGSPILLLDPSGMAAAAGVVLDQHGVEKWTSRAPAPDVAAGDSALLFRTVDGDKRAIRLSIVERIDELSAEAVKFTAGRLHVAIGDKILPLLGCGNTVPAGSLRILRLSDGVGELAYRFGEVIDLVTLGDTLMPAAVPGEVGGVALIDGEQIEVIDSFWMFAEQGGATESARPGLLCALDTDDPWMENILRPLIEAAGHRVVRLGDTQASGADLLITAAGKDPVLDPAPQPVLRVRATPEPSGGDDDSIYRYDRAGLLAVLNAHARKRGG